MEALGRPRLPVATHLVRVGSRKEVKWLKIEVALKEGKRHQTCTIGIEMLAEIDCVLWRFETPLMARISCYQDSWLMLYQGMLFYSMRWFWPLWPRSITNQWIQGKLGESGVLCRRPPSPHPCKRVAGYFSWSKVLVLGWFLHMSVAHYHLDHLDVL